MMMMMMRYARLSQYDQRRVLQLKEAPTRLKTRIGCRKTTSESMNEIDVVRDTTTPHLPPWKRLENLTFDKLPLTKPKNEYTQEELLKLSLHKIPTITGGGRDN